MNGALREIEQYDASIFACFDGLGVLDIKTSLLLRRTITVLGVVR